MPTGLPTFDFYDDLGESRTRSAPMIAAVGTQADRPENNQLTVRDCPTWHASKLRPRMTFWVTSNPDKEDDEDDSDSEDGRST
jgi:hypothetical protein